SEVLRERKDGHSAAWDSIVKHCLEGMASFDDSAMQELLALAGDAERVAELMTTIEKGAQGGISARSAAIMRMIRGFIEAVTDRLAQAFQALVGDSTERERLLTMSRDDVAASPLGSVDGFDGVWKSVAQKLLTSYSDKPYISDAYARELSSARTQAVAVEKVSDDPPERVTSWLTTVSTTAVRTLDISLLLDLLRIEENDARCGDLVSPVVRTLEDLLLVGDFEAAVSL